MVFWVITQSSVFLMCYAKCGISPPVFCNPISLYIYAVVCLLRTICSSQYIVTKVLECTLSINISFEETGFRESYIIISWASMCFHIFICILLRNNILHVINIMHKHREETTQMDIDLKRFFILLFWIVLFFLHSYTFYPILLIQIFIFKVYRDYFKTVTL